MSVTTRKLGVLQAVRERTNKTEKRYEDDYVKLPPELIQRVFLNLNDEGKKSLKLTDKQNRVISDLVLPHVREERNRRHVLGIDGPNNMFGGWKEKEVTHTPIEDIGFLPEGITRKGRYTITKTEDPEGLVCEITYIGTENETYTTLRQWFKTIKDTNGISQRIQHRGDGKPCYESFIARIGPEDKRIALRRWKVDGKFDSFKENKQNGTEYHPARQFFVENGVMDIQQWYEKDHLIGEQHYRSSGEILFSKPSEGFEFRGKTLYKMNYHELPYYFK